MLHYIALIVLFLAGCQSLPTSTLILEPLLRVEGACFGLHADNYLYTSGGVFSLPDGTRHVTEGNFSLFRVSPDNKYYAANGGVYDATTDELLFALGEGSESHYPTFSPDSQKIASQNMVYEVPSGQQLLVWDTPPDNGVLFSPDSRYVVAIHDAVYDLETGESVFSVARTADSPSLAYASGVSSAFTNDGSRLVLLSNGIFDMTNGTRLARLTHDSMIYDDKWVSSVYYGLIDITNGIIRFNSLGSIPPILSPDRSLVAISDQEGKGEYNGVVYRVDTGEVVFRYEGSYPIFTSDGSHLVLTGGGVYTIPDGERLYELTGSTASISPDNNWLAIGDGSMRELKTGKQRYSVSGSGGRFSPDSRLFATSDIVYETANGAVLLENFTGQPFFNSSSGWMFVTEGNECAAYGVKSD